MSLCNSSVERKRKRILFGLGLLELQSLKKPFKCAQNNPNKQYKSNDTTLKTFLIKVENPNFENSIQYCLRNIISGKQLFDIPNCCQINFRKGH